MCDVKREINELMPFPAGKQTPDSFGAKVAKALMDRTTLTFLPNAPLIKYAVVYNEQVGLGIITNDVLENPEHVECLFLGYSPAVTAQKKALRVVAMDLRAWQQNVREQLGLEEAEYQAKWYAPAGLKKGKVI